MNASTIQPYPLRFTSAAQSAPWGGTLFADFRKNSDGGAGNEAVRWELLDTPEYASVVANGPASGCSLTELMTAWGQELVGERHRPGNPFPIYARILDVGKPLAMMVHPDEAVCRAHPEQQTNTKFWYCLAARERAQFMVGIKARVTAMQMKQDLSRAMLSSLLQTFPAFAGDSYLIPAGRVHSVSDGVLIWEIGQTPGEPLEVHAPGGTGDQGGDLAWGSVHFEDRQVARICRETGNVFITRRVPLVRHCPFFVVEEIRITDNLSDRTDGASFHLFTVAKGVLTLVTAAGSESLSVGDQCLVPASTCDYRLVAGEGGAAVLRSRMQSLKGNS